MGNETQPDAAPDLTARVEKLERLVTLLITDSSYQAHRNQSRDQVVHRLEKHHEFMKNTINQHIQWYRDADASLSKRLEHHTHPMNGIVVNGETARTGPTGSVDRLTIKHADGRGTLSPDFYPGDQTLHRVPAAPAQDAGPGEGANNRTSQEMSLPSHLVLPLDDPRLAPLMVSDEDVSEAWMYAEADTARSSVQRMLRSYARRVNEARGHTEVDR